jgi:D-serine deaminase-like pyridoxal phosphate-dependent protein
VLIEVDCGDHRCGVDPHGDDGVAIARLLAGTTAVRFAGVLTHGGHSYERSDADGVRAVARQERDVAVGFAERLRGAGVAVATVSVGSTPTVTHADGAGGLAGVTEVRPGNYAFFDAFQAAHGSCGWADVALTALAAVVHCDRRAGRLVIDAGAIALSKDLGPRDVEPGAGFGRVLALDGSELGARVRAVSQEHGEIELPPGVSAELFPVGARVRVLVNHSCLTAAQHALYHVVEGGRVVATWEAVRGW